jgi:alcohol dehydrogenase (cytochrome c)
MLRNPDPGDWPNWRRTDDAWGYSPLTEIDTDNVGRLQLAWAWAMDDTGGQEAAPLVVDGVMYLPHPLGVIQALDAATGDLLWEYRPGVTPRMDGTPTTENSGVPAGSFAGVGRGVQKNIAIYGDMVYSATGNASIVAIDARTGHQVWESQTADPALGYFYTAGPIVADGTVITGITGCERFKDDVCFITGHDPLTGEERWRTSTNGPRLLVDLAGETLGQGCARHGRRRALHELEPGPRPRHGGDRVALPVPAGRDT